MDMRPIEIDFEVHKQIESRRTRFEDSPNSVLRRVFGLEKTIEQNHDQVSTKRSWSGKGVTLNDGTKLRMEYNGTVYQGVISDGSWVIEGQKFTGPSAAASGIAVTKDGGLTSLNGWNYWEVRSPGSEKWVRIHALRK